MLIRPIGNAHNIDEMIEIGALVAAPTVSSATNAAESYPVNVIAAGKRLIKSAYESENPVRFNQLESNSLKLC